MSKLLPCPFCGSRNAGMHSEHDSDTGGVFLSIKCPSCHASSGAAFSTNPCPQTYQEVRDEWNRRAALASSDAQADSGKSEAVAVIGPVFQLLYCRENWSAGLKVGMKLYAGPQAEYAPRVNAELLDLVRLANNGVHGTHTVAWQTRARAALLAASKEQA